MARVRPADASLRRGIISSLRLDPSLDLIIRQRPLRRPEPAFVRICRPFPDQAPHRPGAALGKRCAQGRPARRVQRQFALGADEEYAGDPLGRKACRRPLDPEGGARFGKSRPLRRSGFGRGGQRKHQPAIAGEAIDPSLRRPLDGEIDIDALGLGLRMACAVVVDDTDIGPILQIGSRHLRQFGVELDRRYLPLRTGQLGEDSRVVAGAGADMHDAVAGLHVQMRQHPGVEGRLAIVDSFRRLQGEEGVLVQQGRVVVWQRDLAPLPGKRPAAGRHEFLARHRSKGLLQAPVAHLRRGQYLGRIDLSQKGQLVVVGDHVHAAHCTCTHIASP